MKVRMLKTVNGKVDGVKMGPYLKDHEYDLEYDRARLFVGSSLAEAVDQPNQEEAAPAAFAGRQHRRGRRGQ